MGTTPSKDYIINHSYSLDSGSGSHWKIFSAKIKENHKDISILNINKNSIPRKYRNEGYYSLIRNEMSVLSRLKHPFILNLIKMPYETRSDFFMVTEPIECSLENIITYKHNLNITELDIKNGIRQISEALLFCHREVKLFHLNVSTSSIYLSKDGNWKLGGFTFCQNIITINDKIKLDWEFVEMEDRLICPSIEILAPEVAFNKIATNYSDSFSIGILLFKLYMFLENINNNNVGDDFYQYKNFVKSLNVNKLNNPITNSNLNASLKNLITDLLNEDPDSRLSLNDFLISDYFSDSQLTTLVFLENILEKEIQERVNFLKNVPKIIKNFEKKLVTLKFLPPLLMQIRDRSLAYYVLPSIIEITKIINKDDFNNKIFPELKYMLNSKIQDKLMFEIIKFCPLIVENINLKNQSSYIVPFFSKALGSTNSSVVIQTIKELTKISTRKSDNFTYRDIKTHFLPKINRLCCIETTNHSLPIRVNSLICLSKIFHLFDTDTIIHKILSSIEQAIQKEPTSAIIMCSLGIYDSISIKVGINITAKHILPKLIPLTINKSLNYRQAKMVFTVINKNIKELETKRMDELKINNDNNNNFDVINKEMEIINLDNKSGYNKNKESLKMKNLIKKEEKKDIFMTLLDPNVNIENKNGVYGGKNLEKNKILNDYNKEEFNKVSNDIFNFDLFNNDDKGIINNKNN